MSKRKPKLDPLQRVEGTLRVVRKVERFFCIWEQHLVEIERENEPQADKKKPSDVRLTAVRKLAGKRNVALRQQRSYKK
jgi:hypothetical protein